MHYDQFLTQNMATTIEAKAPDTAVVPPAPGDGELDPNQAHNTASPSTDTTQPVTHDPASIDTHIQLPPEHQRRPSATAVIDAVLAEDEEKTKHQSVPVTEPPTSKSRRSSRSMSRSRPTSAAGSRRGSTSVWDHDAEKKQRKLVKKIFGHRWIPDFLK